MDKSKTMMQTHTYETIKIDNSKSGVIVVLLNRHKAHNALSNKCLSEITELLFIAEQDAEIKAVVISGNERVFAAGADLKEMSELDLVGVLKDVRPGYWKKIASFNKPILVAVNGLALGAGCELVMHADIAICGNNAQFGQPEINFGIIPGAGGTQRLVRTVGKSLAMKMILTGEFISSNEALASGLVSEITIPEMTLERTIEIAQIIATKPPLAVQQAKEVILKAYETNLESGLQYERKAFVVLSGTKDRDEGIRAFIEKRKPEFKGQ